MKNHHLLAASLTLLALLPPACGKKHDSDSGNEKPTARAEAVNPGGDPSDAPTGKDVLNGVSKAARTTKDYLKDKARRTGVAVRESAEEVGNRVRNGAADLAGNAGRMKEMAGEKWRDTRDWMLKSYEQTSDWGHEKKTEALATWEEILVRSDEEIARLKKLADDAGDAGAANWRQSIDALEKQKQLAEEKLADVSQASFESWDELKGQFHQATGDLHQAYKDARENIEGEEE